MRISDQTTVGDLAASLPASIRVFERHGLDFCCGGQKSLAAVCEEAGLSIDEVTDEIAAEAEAGACAGETCDWATEPVPRLLDHIVSTYHASLREDLPRLQSLAAKVVAAHGTKTQVCAQVQAIVDSLATDLLAHMRKEEVVFFPAIRRLVAGQPVGLPLQAPLAVMEAEHDHAGALLHQLRTITDGYVPPGWACPTVRALYAQLEQFERAMHVHVHLENNVVFPRAAALAGAVR